MWGGEEGTIGLKLGVVVVCVDDPTAHQLTSGSNMESHADTHTSFRPHTRPLEQRCVCVGRREGEKRCVRGILGRKG